MNALNQIIGALVEAWGEVKGQKSRVVLSLVGVVAAVAAMTTVIALGDLMLQSAKELTESQLGRATTLHVAVSHDQSASSGEQGGGGSMTYVGGPAGPVWIETPEAKASDEATTDAGWSAAASGIINDPVGAAMAAVADRFAIPYWSRMENGGVEFTELIQAQNSGTFRGLPVEVPQWGWETPSIKAVDPAYSTLFRIEPSQGRWIAASDVDQRVVPVVVNSNLWGLMGRAPIDAEPIVLTANDGSGTLFRVVGVVEAASRWESPTAYVDYTTWQLVKPSAEDAGSSSSAEMLVWVGEDQADQARRDVPRAVAAVLGQGWKAKVYGGEKDETTQGALESVQRGIMIAGGVVIFLGALGLLNVAIVTVRQRVREIGIRRAMGASARRVFFAVFLESVVATFVAGVLGVGIAILVIRFMPLESLEIYLQDKPAFPVGAAAAGVAISTAIGALCGIIPAFAAVKIKPIDAIRY
ncbi:ABC transporter permease [Actinomyces sp. B33]|uniref:ABC transporter permease n=1 Tax=Actinomyces sp. B33 TaxID=2942131 RepID=UPI00234009F5|nr:ABC transporter permease [Actinomyces sp. B33]MDC4233457.1 ABC transporter permease [Actinomyces sp. B33]